MAIINNDELEEDPKKAILNKLMVPGISQGLQAGDGPGAGTEPIPPGGVPIGNVVMPGQSPPSGAGLPRLQSDRLNSKDPNDPFDPSNPFPDAPPPTGGGDLPPTPTGEKLPPTPPTAPAPPKGPYNAPAGYDTKKFGDATHKTPKYDVARIMQEAAGGKGNLADPAERQTAIDNILKAYPGAKYDGKDKITFPDGGTVDVFEGAGAGRYGIAWQPVTGPGGAALPDEGGESQTMPAGGGSSAGFAPAGGGTGGLDDLLSGGDPNYAIQKALAEMVGPERSNAMALLQKLMGR